MFFRLLTVAAETQTPSFSLSPSFQIPETWIHHVSILNFPTYDTKEFLTWSGWGDLNPRPQRPERCALTKLRYIPKSFNIFYHILSIDFSASSRLSILKNSCFTLPIPLVPLKIQQRCFLNSLTALYSPLK